jgi:hypothetical protein
MDYPQDFPAESRAKVEAEKILAYRNLDRRMTKVSSGIAAEGLVRDCIVRIFLVFAKELCAFGQANGRTVDRVGSDADEFLRRLAIMILYDRPGLGGSWISNWNGSLTQDAEREFRQSPKWKKYEDLLLKLATTQQKEKGLETVEALYGASPKELGGRASWTHPESPETWWSRPGNTSHLPNRKLAST